MSYPFKVTPATLDVIEVLLSGDDELFGWKIANAIDRPTGSVYPILMRLENCGWVTSQWESAEADRSGARRRYYSLDPDHLGAARTLLAERRTKAKPVRSFLRPGFEGA